MTRLILISFISVLTIISGCNIINPEEKVPTYLHIDPYTFSNPDSAVTGSSSHLVTSSWVYFNGFPVGVFDLPCTVPVVTDQAGTIYVLPGVTNQGIKSYQIQYPFYRGDTFHLEYNPGKTQSFKPATRYYESLTSSNFPLIETFDNGNIFTKLSGDTFITRSTDASLRFEGTASGYIYMKSPQTTSESISTISFLRSTNNCYMELNYKCSLPFQVGIKGADSSGNTYGEYLAGFNPKNEWNKVYIDLMPFMRNYYYFSKFFIMVRVALNDPGKTYNEGWVILDNIKIVTN